MCHRSADSNVRPTGKLIRFRRFDFSLQPICSASVGVDPSTAQSVFWICRLCYRRLSVVKGTGELQRCDKMQWYAQTFFPSLSLPRFRHPHSRYQLPSTGVANDTPMFRRVKACYSNFYFRSQTRRKSLLNIRLPHVRVQALAVPQHFECS